MTIWKDQPKMRRYWLGKAVETPIGRLLRHTRRTADGCWEWTAQLNEGGYGRAKVGGRSGQAHRHMYELVVGPISAGLTIDHLCRNRRCVNPDHLEAVPIGVNTRRSPIAPAAVNARKTHCKRGHPFDEANTYPRPTGRGCRECKRRWDRSHPRIGRVRNRS